MCVIPSVCVFFNCFHSLREKRSLEPSSRICDAVDNSPSEETGMVDDLRSNSDLRVDDYFLEDGID